MTGSRRSRPVVVGVDHRDGSRPALVWAADEAERRGVQLRLAHATAPNHHRSYRAVGSGRRKAGRRVL
ncbi:universal stress protein [Streptomyces sp. NRRL B-24484]|uniref:universal stress protein n=1 Tax=Streptomyces sp. NRRL B-24484 TaxID=1463833 RepID=UPI000693A840|nr:universal stress protein [Streptomyces sp. NRRL B-24484]